MRGRGGRPATRHGRCHGRLMTPPARLATTRRRTGDRYCRHWVKPTGPARSGQPDDRLRDEAIQHPRRPLDCFVTRAMTNESEGKPMFGKPHCPVIAVEEHYWDEELSKTYLGTESGRPGEQARRLHDFTG